MFRAHPKAALQQQRLERPEPTDKRQQIPQGEFGKSGGKVSVDEVGQAGESNRDIELQQQ